MASYIKNGVVRKIDHDEPTYGRAPLNIVASPGEKLRITMDAR